MLVPAGPVCQPSSVAVAAAELPVAADIGVPESEAREEVRDEVEETESSANNVSEKATWLVVAVGLHEQEMKNEQ